MDLLLQLIQICFNFDFIGSCADESVDDFRTIQIPGSGFSCCFFKKKKNGGFFLKMFLFTLFAGWLAKMCCVPLLCFANDLLKNPFHRHSLAGSYRS